MVVLVALVVAGVILVSQKNDVSLLTTEKPGSSTNDSDIVIPEKVSGDTAEIKVGESKVIRGLTVNFVTLVNDYRCPVDAQCIEAGAVVAKVTLTDGANTETFNIPSDEVPHEFGPYKISIEKVSPDLHSGSTIKPTDYKVTFKVIKGGA